MDTEVIFHNTLISFMHLYKMFAIKLDSNHIALNKIDFIHLNILNSDDLNRSFGILPAGCLLCYSIQYFSVLTFTYTIDNVGKVKSDTLKGILPFQNLRFLLTDIIPSASVLK